MKETETDRLSRWFDAHAAGLVLYACQWLDRPAAEDVVQDVFLRLSATPADPASEKAWLFAAVRNASISAYRTRRRRDVRERSVSRREWFEAKTDELLDAAAAEEALGALPPEHREVIVLRIWAGLSLPEISRVTATPVSTLFTRYKAGLNELRRQMETPCKTNVT